MLGIGPSHQPVVENLFGESYARPFTRTRESLLALRKLMSGEVVDLQGEELRARGRLALDAAPPPLLVAALGPRMLELAGREADGTVLWMVGPTTVGEHIAPRIRDAAAKADRPAPRIVAGVPVCVTDDVAAARRFAVERLGDYGRLPAYRAMLDREGSPVRRTSWSRATSRGCASGSRRYAAAGTTDLRAAPLCATSEETERTRALLAALAQIRSLMRVRWAELFGIDLRSLALFRIALAALLLVDLARRAGDFTAFYTEAGVLPVEALRLLEPRAAWLSLHALVGSSALAVAALFALAAVAAVALLLGWRTRVATAVSWYLLASLQMRNPVARLDGRRRAASAVLVLGHVPAARRAHVARRRARPALRAAPALHVSAATVALLGQICLVYFATGAQKTGALWEDGTAVRYALELDPFVTGFGAWLRDEAPWLLPLATHGVRWFERVGPLLAFSPIATGPVRTLAVALFFGFHLLARRRARHRALPGRVHDRVARLPARVVLGRAPAPTRAGAGHGRRTGTTRAALAGAGDRRRALRVGRDLRELRQRRRARPVSGPRSQSRHRAPIEPVLADVLAQSVGPRRLDRADRHHARG